MCLMGSLRSMLCVASGTKRQTVFQNSFHLATTVITAALGDGSSADRDIYLRNISTAA